MASGRSLADLPQCGAQPWPLFSKVNGANTGFAAGAVDSTQGADKNAPRE